MIQRKLKPCTGGCGRCVPYYKKKQCKACWFKNNPPEKRYKPKKKIKPVSDKRAGEINQYRKQRAEFLKKNPCCAIGLPGCSGCDERFHNVHHTRGRENNLLLDEKYWINACIFCHDRIHTTDSKWAYDNGFLVSKHQLPKEEN